MFHSGLISFQDKPLCCFSVRAGSTHSLLCLAPCIIYCRFSVYLIFNYLLDEAIVFYEKKKQSQTVKLFMFQPSP